MINIQHEKVAKLMTIKIAGLAAEGDTARIFSDAGGRF